LRIDISTLAVRWESVNTRDRTLKELSVRRAWLAKVRNPATWAWPESKGPVWTFTATDHGWAFAQIPEMLLPGDNAQPIQSSN
jgi:hypothetical protein